MGVLSDKKTRGRLYAALLLILVFVWLGMVANGERLVPAEQSLFRSIYGMSDDLYLAALLITQLGSAWVQLGVVGLLFVVRWSPKLAVLLLRNGVITYAVVQVTKLMIGRPRPAGLLEDFAARELFVHGQGFPSGHTAVATMTALTLLPYIPRRWRWLPFVVVILVGWSRVYLGVHTPLDVLGGLIVGVVVALLASYLPDFIPRRPSK